MAYKDITGMRFGYVIVIKETDPIVRNNGNIERRWLCRCDCGNQVIINRSTLKEGTSTSCGCKTKPIEIKPGDRFNKLLILKQVENVREKTGHKRRAFLCRCDCGNIVIIKGHDFNKNRISCGHCGKNKSKEKTKKDIKVDKLYRIWYGMKKRCEDPQNHAFHYYGGKGVRICNEWKGDNGYDNFKTWAMNNGYSDKLSIDRINPNGDYSPDNCRWADSKTQMRNRTNNIHINFNGEMKVLSEVVEETGVKYGMLYSRIKKGMNVEDAINDIKEKLKRKTKITV